MLARIPSNGNGDPVFKADGSWQMDLLRVPALLTVSNGMVTLIAFPLDLIMTEFNGLWFIDGHINKHIN